MADEGSRLVEELMRFKPDRLTANAWAVQAGVSRTIWADLRRHGNPSRKTLEKLLSAAGSSLAEFEAIRIGQAVPKADLKEAGLAEKGPRWRPAPLKPIPLLACRAAGEWGEPGSGIELMFDRSVRPRRSAHRPDSLAARWRRLCGDRIRPGDVAPLSPRATTALLRPRAQAPATMLVQLANGAALIKEMFARTAGIIELRQFNPDMRLCCRRGRRCGWVHKVR